MLVPILIFYLLPSVSLTDWTLISSTNKRSTINTPLTKLKDVTLEIKSPAGSPSGNMAVNLIHQDDSLGLWEETAVFMWDSKTLVIDLDCLGAGKEIEYDDDTLSDTDEKVWSWRFTPAKMSLSCNGQELYSLTFPDKSLCKAFLETTSFNEISFIYMADKYYRLLYHVTLARDCWTRACGYCGNLDCAVQYNMSEAEGITATSLLTRTRYNKIVLYDGAGAELGSVMWSLSRVHLIGCVACRLPWRRVRFFPRTTQQWRVSLEGGALAVHVAGREVFRRKLHGKCLGHYSRVGFFAFSQIYPGTTFTKLNGMELGKLV